MRRLTILLLTLLLIGGHTAGLQLLAWSTMFAARVQTADSVGQAFVSTLDGSKPCRLCQVVQELDGAAEAPDALPDHVVKAAKKPHLHEPHLAVIRLESVVLYVVQHAAPTKLTPRVPADVELPPPRS